MKTATLGTCTFVALAIAAPLTLAQNRAYEAANQAAATAAQQAFASRMRAEAANAALAAQRAQQSSNSRQSSSSITSPGTGSGGSYGSSSSNTTDGSSTSGALSAAEAARQARWRRYDPDSSYVRGLSRNPPAGTGVLGVWRFEVRHDASGRFASALISATAQDRSSGTPVPIGIGCDVSPTALQAGGPMFMEVDLRSVAATRGRQPTGISLRAGALDNQFASLGGSQMKWRTGGDTALVRGDELAYQLKVAAIAGNLRVYVGYGSYYDPVDALVGDAGFEAAFEKLAPCWTRFWDYEVAALQRPAEPAPGARPAPAPSYAPPNPQADMARALADLETAQPLSPGARPPAATPAPAKR